jgi:hypothetical protein
MRLREIQWRITAAAKLIGGPNVPRRPGDYERINRARELLSEIRGWETLRAGLERQAEKILEAEGVLEVPTRNLEDLRRLLSEVPFDAAKEADDLERFGDMLSQVLPVEKPDNVSASFSLGQGLTVGEFKKRLDDLGDIFEEPLREFANAELRITAVDSGTSTVELLGLAQEMSKYVFPTVPVLAGVLSGAVSCVKLWKEWTEWKAYKKKRSTEDQLLDRISEKLAQGKLKDLCDEAAGDVCNQIGVEANATNRRIASKSTFKASLSILGGTEFKVSSTVYKGIAANLPPELLPPREAMRPTPDLDWEPIQAEEMSHKRPSKRARPTAKTNAKKKASKTAPLKKARPRQELKAAAKKSKK